jgi:hypothetical protein
MSSYPAIACWIPQILLGGMAFGFQTRAESKGKCSTGQVLNDKPHDAVYEILVSTSGNGKADTRGLWDE